MGTCADLASTAEGGAATAADAAGAAGVGGAATGGAAAGGGAAGRRLATAWRTAVSMRSGSRTVSSSRRLCSRAYSWRRSVVDPSSSCNADRTAGATDSVTSSGRRAAMAARSCGRTASATMSVSRSRSRSSTPFTATSPISVVTIPEMAAVTESVSRSPSVCSKPCRRDASLRRAAAHPSSSASDVLSSLTRLPPSSMSMARCCATLAERAWTWRRRPSNSSRIQTRTWGPVSRPCAARGCGSLIGPRF